MIMSRIGNESVGRWQSAAYNRRLDYESLIQQNRIDGAAYLAGYVSECYLKASVFRFYRFRTSDVIDRADWHLYEKDARQQGLMTNAPHDIAGWARYLVWIHDNKNASLGHGLSMGLVQYASLAGQSSDDYWSIVIDASSFPSSIAN